MPPQHLVPGKIVSLKVAGGEFGGHLVVDDHAFQNETIAFYTNPKPQWRSFTDAELKNGAQQVTIEFCTSSLNPNFPPRTGLAKGLKNNDFGHDKRSWLSITGIVTHDAAGTPQDELDAFAHTVAHDLKSPLATLHGRLELASMMLGKVDESAMRHHLAEATTSAKRLNDIIEELLVLAGVRRQAIAPAALDMAAITAESVDRLESLLKQHPATIRFPATWPAAVGHAPWVTEVWVNFISNAAKYGGPDALITLGGAPQPDGASARFWVQDTGSGLDEAAQAQMFVPFTRVSKVRAKGHGLGLSIVRRIVEKLGGQVGVESRPGAGARFWFELPTKASEAPSATKPAVPLLFAP